MMRKIVSGIWTLMLLLIATIQVTAQNVYNKQISVSFEQLEQKGDFVYISMEMDMTNLTVDRNRALTLLPILTSSDHQLELPRVLVNGTNHHRLYLKTAALEDEELNRQKFYAVLKSDNKTQNTGKLIYKIAVPYHAWMDSARLDLNESLCICGGHEEEVTIETLAYRIDLEKVMPSLPAEFVHQLAYVEPEIEKEKVRNVNWEARLDFQANKAEINPNYMDNLSGLLSTEKMINSIRTDKTIIMTGIDIIGFASPEGSTVINEKLSKGRAEVLKEYFLNKLDLPSEMYHAKYGGENWDGLVDLLKASGMDKKDELVFLIESTDNVTSRKNNLKMLDGGVHYREMMTTMYPELRKVICNVNYTVRSFTVDEAKEVLKNQPKHLSLMEMFQIANTYPEGSDEFTDVLETAVKMYPNDPTANLNLAAVALSRKNTQAAQKYLDKSNKELPEYANNLGVFYMLSGESDKARLEFEKAAQGGIDAANYNLKNLVHKQTND